MIPHKCPVCGGTGQVDSSFYDGNHYATTTTIPAETCRTCWGSGIVWEHVTVKVRPCVSDSYRDPTGTADDMIARGGQ